MQATMFSRDLLRKEYLEAKNKGDKLSMARIVLKAKGLGFTKSNKKLNDVKDALT